MYRKQISQKASPSLPSTPISKEIAPSHSYGSGSLSSVVQRVQQDPNSLSGDERQELESAIGTRSTQEILAGKQTPWVPEFQGISAQLWGNSGEVGAPIQAKLIIGEAGDQYEQEADRVAKNVVQQINTPQTNALPNEDSAPIQPTTLQRQQIDDEEELQLKQLPEMVQRREAIAGGEASTDLADSINSARGGGQFLDASLQQSMGQAMGADFSGVRVHTDTQADNLNQSIQAKAFTTGQDVFFRQGEYQPGSRDGQELIAHELTHVVQQNGGAVQRIQLNHFWKAESKLIQRMYLVEGEDNIFHESSSKDEKAFNTRTLNAVDRISLSKKLEAKNQNEILTEIRKEWLKDKSDYKVLIETQANKLVAISEKYAEGINDPLLLQYRIYEFVTQFVHSIVSEILGNLGMDVNDFAVLMVGSAARRELFPASDVDLLLLGKAQVDKEVASAIKANVDNILKQVVTTAYANLYSHANDDKLPFSLDACLSGGLFYTPESAARVASNSAGGSSDNMVADTTLVNTESIKAKTLYDQFKAQYNKKLDEKNSEMRQGFVPERIKEMKEKVEDAKKQLQDQKGGFDVKKGLLRPPSLLARDYSTYRGSEDNKIFGIEAEHTLERLETFTQGNEDTKISSEAVENLKAGFVYGIKLRMRLHIETRRETDILPAKTKRQEMKTIDNHLENYNAAIAEFENIANVQELKPRNRKLDKFFGS